MMEGLQGGGAGGWRGCPLALDSVSLVDTQGNVFEADWGLSITHTRHYNGN